MSEKVKVKILGSVSTVNGTPEIGSTVEMSAHEAEVFADCGAVEIIAAPKPAKPAKPETVEQQG